MPPLIKIQNKPISARFRACSTSRQELRGNGLQFERAEQKFKGGFEGRKAEDTFELAGV
jgi:hypothetical protein